VTGGPVSLGVVWAQAANGVIGRDGGLPWRLPEDMAHFREVTGGSTVLMGRKTWDSLPPQFRPLPGRRNIVLTHDPAWTAEGADVIHSMDEVLHGCAVVGTEPAMGAGFEHIWVIGGAGVYAEALAHATHAEITELDRDFEGDVVAPALGPEWVEVGETPDWLTSSNGLRYRFRRYARSSR